MNNLKDLTLFELKKILKKPAIKISLVVILLVTILSTVGTILGNEYVNGDTKLSSYEGLMLDRQNARSFAGRLVDEDFIMEVSKGYAMVDYSKEENYNESSEYQQYARPYYSIFGIVRTIVSSPERRFGAYDMANLDIATAKNIYNLRQEKIQKTVEQYPISDKAKAMLLLDNEKVETPFVYDYAQGYQRFMTIMYTTGLMIAFFCVGATAPMFAGEYSSRADQLILSSKNGKKSAINAKLLAGFIIALGSAILFTVVTYVSCMAVFGTDGFNASYQLNITLSTDPLTMGQYSLYQALATIVATVTITGITMLLSAKLKSPAGVITIMSLLLVVPMYINIDPSWMWLYNIKKLLTTNMMAIWTINDPIPFEMFGLIIKSRIAVPLFGMIIFLITLPFTYKGFKNHQVN